MRDLMGMMKQARELQSRMQEVQAQIAALEISGSSGGGLVSVTLSGKGDTEAAQDRSGAPQAG